MLIPLHTITDTREIAVLYVRADAVLSVSADGDDTRVALDGDQILHVREPVAAVLELLDPVPVFEFFKDLATSTLGQVKAGDESAAYCALIEAFVTVHLRAFDQPTPTDSSRVRRVMRTILPGQLFGRHS